MSYNTTGYYTNNISKLEQIRDNLFNKLNKNTMKTLILQEKNHFPVYKSENEILIVSESRFYDKHSEKYTLVICYYE